MKLSAAGAAVGVIAPSTVLAGGHAEKVNPMAGGMYYTKESPGRWAKKVGGHMPLVTVSGKSVSVTTPHAMKAHGHYIVKHMILNDKFEFMAEQMFDPTKDKQAVSSYTFDNYSGKINVLSVCNKHDTWLATASV